MQIRLFSFGPGQGASVSGAAADLEHAAEPPPTLRRGVCVCLSLAVCGCLGGRALERSNLQVTLWDGSRLHSPAEQCSSMLGSDVTNW
jgi:hypothetical protein